MTTKSRLSMHRQRSRLGGVEYVDMKPRCVLDARLAEQSRCMVRLAGMTKRPALIIETHQKRYKVLVDGEATTRTVSASKVEPFAGRPTPSLIAQGTAEPWWERMATATEVLAQPKPDKPEKVPCYLAYVRKLSCCNCRATTLIEAHHEGHKGVGQKVRDTLAVPLCRFCHRVYTDTNRLPTTAAEQSDDDYRPALRTREASLNVLQATQAVMLMRVINALDMGQQIDALSKAVALLPTAAVLTALS